MCSIAFRHASGEVPLDHERKTQITHLFPNKSDSWEKDARRIRAGLVSGEKLLSCIKRMCVSCGAIYWVFYTESVAWNWFNTNLIIVRNKYSLIKLVCYTATVCCIKICQSQFKTFQNRHELINTAQSCLSSRATEVLCEAKMNFCQLTLVLFISLTYSILLKVHYAIC